VAHPAVIKHLKSLGITAIELMPVHHFVNDSTLIERGLSNYWGYNSNGFFAPDSRYSSSSTPGGQVREFKEMVRALHEADVELILDVVHNHTAEGNHLGPTLSMRGIDNAAYYRLVEEDKRYYMDYTGTGNSRNIGHPHTLQLIMDSLRYWVTEMHVDGFRFDLAATLAKALYDVGRLSTLFFDLIKQDPVLRQVKLIGEPWDSGPGGYQVGNFPPQWTVWNGRYRDTVRDYWRGETTTLAEFASRLTGSSDLYDSTGRRPSASINFVTAHDSFTLRDLVSYNEKHNEANGEDNRDGESRNKSWNCGVEGPTDDPAINALRARQQRNFLATLLLSQGVPMISHGDELGRTQQGNNNAYCQDNEISWIDWDSVDSALLNFAGEVCDFRIRHPVLRRRMSGPAKSLSRDGRKRFEVPDIAFFLPSGKELTAQDWVSGSGKSLAVFINGNPLDGGSRSGGDIDDTDLLLLFNAADQDVSFVLPDARFASAWARALSTDEYPSDESSQPADITGWGQSVALSGRCLQVLVATNRQA